MSGKYETLHCHTIASDGVLTHREVLDGCVEHGIATVAFTDHDALMDPALFDSLKTEGHETKWISGIELSVHEVKEIPGKIPPSRSFHIIGLFVDPRNGPLREYCESARLERISRMKQLIESLNKLGFDLSYDDVKAFVKGDIVAKPHLVKAILSKDVNKQLLSSFTERMRQEAEQDTKIKEAYDNLLTHTETQRVYDLILGNYPYIQGVEAKAERSLDMDKAVELIRGAGGVAMLAHWFTVNPPLDAKIVEQIFGDLRLDGAETVCGFLDPAEEQPKILAQNKELKELVKRYGLSESGGIDFHLPEHFDLIRKPELAERVEQTVGLTDRLLAKNPHLNKELSTV